MKRKKIRLVQILAALFLSSLSLSAQTIFDQLAGKIDMVVDINGSGDYTTVQEAIDAVPDNNDTWKVIFVKKGVYYEKVILGYKKTKVILVGEDVDSTIISNDNYGNEMLIGGDPNNGGHTFSTYTFRADAHDFQAYNISFENPTTKGQGVAYHSNGDRQILYHCRLLGNQDTYFDNFRTRKYFKDCFIEGTTDYIFGFGVTLFDSCQIHSKSGSYITAASTPQYYEFGQVFKDCRLTASPGVSGISLGRPWYDWANTMFYECWEPASIKPEGWSAWSGGREETCIYREYNCFGPGSYPLNRVEFGKQLDPSKASRYHIDTIFAASNFPSDMGYDVDTNEFMHMRRRQEASGYPARADTIIFAGREELYASGDSFPPYPKENWSPVFYNDVYEVIKNNTYRMMDSVNGIINIKNMLLDGNALDGFDPEITSYGIELDENDTTAPEISIVAENAIVSVNYPATLPGFATVTALSKDKVSGTNYSVYFSKDSAYWDTELKLIVINRTDTVPLEPGIMEYNMQLQSGITRISLFIKNKVLGQYTEKSIPATFPGSIEIEVTAVDKVTRDKYIINVDLYTGMDDSMFPDRGKIALINPVQEKLLVLNQYDQPASPDIALYDLNGKILCSTSLTDLSRGISEVDVDMSCIKAGIYLYRIKLDDDNIFGKLVKLEN